MRAPRRSGGKTTYLVAGAVLAAGAVVSAADFLLFFTLAFLAFAGFAVSMVLPDVAGAAVVAGA